MHANSYPTALQQGDRESIGAALRQRGKAQQELFFRARQARDAVFHGRVEVRSVIEYSNVCEQRCNFCGMNAGSGVKRFILDGEEFLSRVRSLHDAGRRVIMVQTGECHDARYFDTLLDLLSAALAEMPDLVFTCALGDLPEAHYRALQDIGVRRYLLKFETSSPALYSRVKPSHTLEARLSDVRLLASLGFRVSSGNITGLPGQDVETLIDDLLLLRDLALPMCSTSPFIPNERSGFAGEQPADLGLTLNLMAVLRILCPSALIPTTSALETLLPGGLALGLMAGANTITLHDGTPAEQENRFLLYRSGRFLPRQNLMETVAQLGLECSNSPLV